MNDSKSTEVNEIGNCLENYGEGEVLTGAEILLRALEMEGVDTIFGYPGGTVLHIYDALYNCKAIKHILPRHEQGGVHAADGYARSTGRPGVVLATSGPGAANLVTGIATAYMDSIPMVVITGQVAIPAIGRDSFQEADITGITLPITKYGFLVKDIKELARCIHEAFYIATTGRPGPVIVDIPKDITVKTCEFFYPPEYNLPGYKLKPNGIEKELEETVKLIKEAKRPVLYAGGGVIASGAEKQLVVLAEKLDIPVTCTLMAKGAIPDTHPLALGMPGMHGTAYANYAITESDLLLAVGARFDDRVTGNVKTFAPNAKKVHIEIDPAEINKNVVVDVAILGDTKEILGKLLSKLESQKRPDWIAQINEWKEKYPLRFVQGEGTLKPQYVISSINEILEDNSFVVADTGQHQMWSAQYIKTRRGRGFFTSGGLGTMGYGFPAAIGAQVANPESLVVAIVGDGGFQMNCQELATVAVYNLPVKICIINNGYLGMVRQWQDLFLNKRYSHTNINQGPDFVRLAEAFGVKALRVTKPEEVLPALQEAKDYPGSVLIDFIVEKEENVFPMVPAGGSIYEMLGR
ncbi:MAG: biosynthetic-type acetolactate synthase large subunit [Clostridia bacterium]|nr:biosynthetic-type acetolactate synthase large subunit [Clostridia bacterium]